ncbi:MAG: hypothetical protein V4671_00220 [Armatimonadota bacterium]
MAKISVSIEAEDINDYLTTLRQLVTVNEAEDVTEGVGDEKWTPDEIRSLWSKLTDDAKYVLGIVADYMTANEFVARQDLFDELAKYPDAKVKTGTGFGGTLSSYGFAARSLGLRGKKEKLYISDESGYAMRKEYASVVLNLFCDWLKSQGKNKQ